VVVCHADLPRADHLDHLCPEGPDAPRTVIMVPDRHRDGTNVLSLPTGTGFRFSYGPGSFPRHETEARRNGLVVVTLDDPDLAWDVDLPDDLGTGSPPT
jgi:2-phospho-L-lactate guanylyltransferase